VTFRRREVLKAVGAAGVATGGLGVTVATSQESGGQYPPGQPDRGRPRAYEEYTVHRVPEQYETIQAAVNAAEPKDLVLVGPGTYPEAVEVVDTPQLTIRGTDRNEVVLDGEFKREDGILATVDDVVVENMTARHYQRNGFFWSSVSGWRGAYLTAYNNGVYGIYNIDSQHGLYDNCYASGNPDAGYYIGQCEPCHARIQNVRAERNGAGYSGTNASGWLTVTDSTFRNNMVGIVPNSLDSEAHPPQEYARFQNNLVESNNNASAPTVGYTFASFGIGINIAGGQNNEIVNNTVRDHANFGILAGIIADENLYKPTGNYVANNEVSDSGRADLALASPTGGGNEFVDNEFDTARPAGLDGGVDIAPGGDPWVSMVLLKQFRQKNSDENPSGDWQTQPAPPFDELESMPDPETTPPAEAIRR
jgi:hypothetical protein